MADELTSSVDAPVAPSAPVEQAEQASQPEPQPRTPESVAPAQPTRSDNWQDDPKFKEFQSKYNRALNEERQRNQMLQTEMQRVRQEMDSLVTRDMSDDELYRFNESKWQQALEQERMEKQRIYQDYAKVLAMSEIARKTGIDPSVLADAEDPDTAWELAHKESLRIEKARLEATYKDKLASSPGNSPDMGAARPPAPASSGNVPDFNSTEDMVRFYRTLNDEWNS